MIFIKKNKNKMINLKWQDTRELKYVRKGFKFMKRLGSTILAILVLLVTASSGLIFSQGDSGGTTSCEIFEDFENMYTYADIEAFFPQFEFDEDSSVTLSLSEDGGYSGSKAAKIDCNPLAYYLSILDKEFETNRFYTKGEGLSFWLKTEQPTRFKLRILEDWDAYEGEEISVDAGEHFIRIPWSSVKSGENALATNPENKIMRLRLEFLNDGDSGFLINTLYIDEIGYYSDAEPTTSEQRHRNRLLRADNNSAYNISTDYTSTTTSEPTYTTDNNSAYNLRTTDDIEPTTTEPTTTQPTTSTGTYNLRPSTSEHYEPTTTQPTTSQRLHLPRQQLHRQNHPDLPYRISHTGFIKTLKA